MRRQGYRHIGLLLSIVLLSCVALLPGAASAQQASDDDDTAIGLRMGARGMGEVLQEPTITSMYRSTRFTGTGVLSYRAWRFVHVDIEAGYMRDLGDVQKKKDASVRVEDQATVELIPIAVMASAVRAVKRADLFASVGPAITQFSAEEPEGSITGTKWGLSVQLGARLDTGLVRPTMRPGDSVRLQGVDLEIVLGRRQHQLFGVGDGWNLSAWRAGVGLMARF